MRPIVVRSTARAQSLRWSMVHGLGSMVDGRSWSLVHGATVPRAFVVSRSGRARIPCRMAASTTVVTKALRPTHALLGMRPSAIGFYLRPRLDDSSRGLPRSCISDQDDCAVAVVDYFGGRVRIAGWHFIDRCRFVSQSACAVDRRNVVAEQSPIRSPVLRGDGSTQRRACLDEALRLSV